jgi:geranylgeranylglycerol-phosphate geranylgeranyltransferase
MIKVWIILTRPFNVLITSSAVFIGALLTGSLAPLGDLILAMCSAALICAGGNALNDYFDIEIDRINKPGRPLPAGRIKPPQALAFGIICLVAGIILSIFINAIALILAAAASALLVSYNAYLKRKAGLAGNMVVSIAGALPIVYGGAAVNNLAATPFPAVFAFLFHLGREIIKDLEDKVGDALAKSRSIPGFFSPGISYRIGFIPLCILFVITPLPYLLHLYNIYYFIIVLPFVNLLLLISFFFFRNKLEPRSMNRLSTLLKLGMVFGLLSLIVGTLHLHEAFLQ